ncbi:MAG: enoyl-CoA hydratase/isomerase family protein [Deltaproteobacteria bacterium]|nr:enoyl-CoA hydratase/isomerase family protein [Deltaproteobacteria bacterium]
METPAAKEVSMPDHFLFDKDGRIATITFNRPEKRNPLNEGVLLELEGILQQVRDDKDIRVVILTGTGNTFCAGADLSLVKGITDPAERHRIFAPIGKVRARLVGRVLDTLANLEQVTIAAVNGYAAGGGWSFTLACDLRVAVEEAEFWFPEVDLGVPLSPTSTAYVVAHVGPALAKEIIIGCRRFKAAELLTMGMLNRVVKKAELMPTVSELAQSLAKKNPNAVMVSKATVNALALGQTVLRPDLLMTRD